MSHRHGTADNFHSYHRYGDYRPSYPSLFEAVLSRRVAAFAIDAFLVGLMIAPVAVVVFVLGFLTFGAAWLLMGPIAALIALAYVGLTAGGRASATLGMRFMGIELRTTSGRPMFPLLAVAHAVLFWISLGLLTPFVLLLGLVTERRRLLHDILLGVEVVNTDNFYD